MTKASEVLITMRHPDGEVTTHLRGGVSDYATLCGVAEDGDVFSGVELDHTNGQADCSECRLLWNIARKVPPRFLKKEQK